MTAPLSTLVLAGSRPGQDPLLAESGLPSKALLPVAGKPMLAHVLGALAEAPGVGTVTVVAQDTAPFAAEKDIAGACRHVEWHNSTGSIADAIRHALEAANGPLFVTTADNVLLTPAIVNQFLAESDRSDVSVGMVERSQVEAAGYLTKRTWLKFRGGHWSGCNVFRLDGAQVLPLVEFWRGLEQDRKKGFKLIGTFGPGLFMGAALRLIDIHGFAARAASRFGLSATVVQMKAAEACIDADKPSDIPVIEEILAARQAAASA